MSIKRTPNGKRQQIYEKIRVSEVKRIKINFFEKITDSFIRSMSLRLLGEDIVSLCA